MSSDITNAGPILKEQVFIANKIPVKIIKREGDPIALRTSIGGLENVGFYFVYRGDLNMVREMLKTCWLALEQFEE